MGAAALAGEILSILNLSSSGSLGTGTDPVPAVTGSIADALRLGCVAIGFSIHPGSAVWDTMYGQLRELAAEAKQAGLVVVVWSCPRGSGVSAAGQTRSWTSTPPRSGRCWSPAAAFAGAVPGAQRRTGRLSLD